MCQIGSRWTNAPRQGLSATKAELEALALIEQQPGMTVAQLQTVLGVSRSRVWQIVNRLERGRVRLQPWRDT
jgi:uncharacterized membrane protein